MSDIMPSISAAKNSFLEAQRVDPNSPAAEMLGMISDIYDFYRGAVGIDALRFEKTVFRGLQIATLRCEQAFDVVSVAEGEVFRTRLAEGARCFVQLLSVDELFDLVCLIHDIAKVHFCREYGASMLPFFRRAR